MRQAIIAALPLLAACATPGKVKPTVFPKASLEGPREVALTGTRGEIERAIEDSLRGRGFRIKRYASTDRVAEADAPGRVTTYNEATVRYVLETDWALTDRCFGGGFRFNFIRVDLIDTKLNEVVLSLSAKGYSEKCSPLSGSIFGGIARALDDAWPKEQQVDQP